MGVNYATSDAGYWLLVVPSGGSIDFAMQLLDLEAICS